MSISTFEPSMVDSQSMINGQFWYIEMEWNGSVQSTSPQFTAMQHKKWAWTASHPTQRPFKLPSTFPTLPASSVWGFSGSSDFPSLVSSASYGMVADLIWSRWAAGGRKSQCSANAWWWWWRFLWLRYYSDSNLFPRQNHFCSRVSSNKHSCRFPLDYARCQMSYSAFPANIWLLIRCSKKVFHTTKAHYHQACPYPLSNPSMVDSQSMINGQYNFWYIEMESNGSVQSTSYPQKFTATQHKKWVNSFPPNSAPTETAFHHSNPSNLFTLSILWFLRFPIFGELGVGLNGRGLDRGSVQSQNKGKWAEQLGRRWEKESMLSQCLMMVVKVFFVKILVYFFRL